MIDFLKPTKKKVIWSVILFAFLIYLISTLLTYFYDVDLPMYLDILYWSTVWPALGFAALLNFFQLPDSLYEVVIIIGGLVLQAFYSYFLVCLIVWISKKFKGKRKR